MVMQVCYYDIGEDKPIKASGPQCEKLLRAILLTGANVVGSHIEGTNSDRISTRPFTMRISLPSDRREEFENWSGVKLTEAEVASGQ